MSSMRNSIVEEDLASIISAPLPWEALSGATLLVSGAAGFLPAYMVETILHLNQTRLARPALVIALVRNFARARERFHRYLDRDDLQIVIQDISVPLSVSEPFDYVIHAASQATPLSYRTDPVGTLSANVLGTCHLLTAAQKHPVKGFLFFSSGEIYGIIQGSSKPIAEHDGGFLDPTDVRSCYGESKRMGETMCVAWAHQYGIPTRIVRPFHTYGPGMRLDDGRVFADFVRDIIKGGPIVLQSDGSTRRSFCYLADATIGFFTVLFKGEDGTAYNIANPNSECSIADLADRLAIEFQSERIGVQRHVRTDQNYLVSPILSALPDIDKAKSLGWNPTHSIEQGFRRTVESYR
jgi:UDP-glucuronate decarboxylase